MKKTAKTADLEKRIEELTGDLQRMRADFENYRKRVEGEKEVVKQVAVENIISRLLPIIDTVERAVAHTPKEIAHDPWVEGISGLSKQLATLLAGLQLERIDASVDTVFDPELHQAVQFDNQSEGDQEVIAEELQTGYKYNGAIIRPSMVRVTTR